MPQLLPRHDERFRLLVESVQDYAIFLLDPEGRVQSWNAGAQQLKGYTAEEIVGRSLETFYPAEAVARGWPRTLLARAAEFGRVEDEGWRVRRDGSLFWASVVLTALRDSHGTLTGYAKVTRDLSERRRQEEALRHSEQQLRLLMESVQDYAIFMLDPEGRVLTWNAGARAITGHAAEDVIGQPFSVFFTAQDHEAGVPQRELAAARTWGRAEAEGWRVRHDGTPFWANTVVTPVRDEHGVLRGYAQVTRDLSAQRRMQELEHSSRRMHEFLALLAHELRNPLAPIRNASEIMQHVPELPAPLVRVRQIIDRQVRHLTRLIDDLLDVARIVNGKIALRPEALDFREVVQTGVDTLRPVAAARHQALTLTLPAQPLRMTGDATRLAQALQNLLSNASRYTPEGGSIHVQVGVEGQACLTTVSDTGHGIEPDALERIFDLFEQLPTPHDHGDGGLGLGLGLARKLAELHGGMLTAASAGHGQGSTFTLLLPLQPPDAPDAPRQAAAAGAAAAAPQALRVLVVDDNRDSADTMVTLLTLLGHEARAVYGARETAEAARLLRPQVVLLDLNMPDGDGFTVLAQLRALEPELAQTGDPSAPVAARPLFVAAMTGYGQGRDRIRTAQAGFQAHLTKPVGIEELRQVLRNTAA